MDCHHHLVTQKNAFTGNFGCLSDAVGRHLRQLQKRAAAKRNIALACGEPAAGYASRTVWPLAEKDIALHFVDGFLYFPEHRTSRKLLAILRFQRSYKS